MANHPDAAALAKIARRVRPGGEMTDAERIIAGVVLTRLGVQLLHLDEEDAARVAHEEARLYLPDSVRVSAPGGSEHG